MIPASPGWVVGRRPAARLRAGARRTNHLFLKPPALSNRLTYLALQVLNGPTQILTIDGGEARPRLLERLQLLDDPRVVLMLIDNAEYQVA